MKKFLAITLVICVLLGLCACGSKNSPSGSNNTPQNQTQKENVTTTSPKFSVTVTDDDGNIIEGVVLQMCKDSCIPARTDANGVATFNLAVTDGYKLSVVSCPEGYEYTGESNILIEEDSTEYTLKISKK